MKKILGISLIAVLAVSPMMAMAAAGDVDKQPGAAAENATGITAQANPKYALAVAAGTDSNVASAGYVKGAYNAAIRAINTVHDEAASAASDAETNAKTYAKSYADGLASNYATAAQGLKADSALQSAGTGLTKDGTTVALSSETQAALVKANSALQAADLDDYAKTADVTTAIATAKSEAISSAAADATTKANAAQSAAESYTDTKLQAYTTTTDMTSAIATAKSEAISSAAADATTKADAAESAAKSYADGLNTAMGTRVDALESANSALGNTYATKTGVAATVNSATVAYDIMQTWGSDSATSATYDVAVASYVAQ